MPQFCLLPRGSSSRAVAAFSRAAPAARFHSTACACTAQMRKTMQKNCSCANLFRTTPLIPNYWMSTLVFLIRRIYQLFRESEARHMPERDPKWETTQAPNDPPTTFFFSVVSARSMSPESGRHGIFLWVVGSCSDCQATQAGLPWRTLGQKGIMRMIYTANKWLYMGDLPSKNGDIGGCNETTSPQRRPPNKKGLWSA